MTTRLALIAAGVVMLAGGVTLAAAPARAQTAPDDISPFIRELAPSRVVELELRTTDLTGTARTTERQQTTEIALATDVLFAFDKATLSADADDVLADVAAQLRDEAAGRGEIRGHTDGKGGTAYNRRLSQRRAAAVERRLRATLEQTDLQFKVTGRGERDPVAPNQNEDGSDNPEGRALNRRVEIEFRTAATG